MKARDNPFASDRVLGVRYRPQGTSWDTILRDLDALSYRAAIVGPEGSGKTTLLEDLEDRLGPKRFAIHWLRLNRSMLHISREIFRQVPAELGPRDLLFFDGADLLGAMAWRRFLWRTRPAAGLVTTSHRPGMLPTLLECHTNPALLDHILVDLLGQGAQTLHDSMPQLFARHRGNLRDVLRELYDAYANAA